MCGELFGVLDCKPDPFNGNPYLIGHLKFKTRGSRVRLRFDRRDNLVHDL
jgi:hypothetical protein